MLKKIFRNQRGGTLALVVIMSFVVMAFAMSTIFIASSSNKQTFGEENKTQAFYIAKTGAESFIHHLEEMSKKGEDVKAELVKLKDEGLGKGEYDNGEFTLEIREIDTNKYEIESRGKINKVEDWIIAELTIDDIVGGGSNTGDGKIFIAGENEGFYSEFVMQLQGAGLSIYTMPKKYDNKVPVKFNEVKNNPPNVSNSGQLNKLFGATSSRVSTNTTVEKLNKHEEQGYRLEIEEPSVPTTTINGVNPIKIDNLVRYTKDGKKDETFEKIKFIYDTNQKDILDYFSKNTLKISSMTDTEIKKALENAFLLPLRTKQDYESYIDGKSVYPDAPVYSLPSGGFDTNSKGLNGDKELNAGNSPMDLDLTKETDVKIPNGLIMNNGGYLKLRFSGDTNVLVDGKLEMKDSNKHEEIHIYTDAKVDFYINGEAKIDGSIIVHPTGDKAEVNFYMSKKNSDIQINNGAKVEGVNIYAPNNVVDIKNNIQYQGIIVGKKVTIGTGSTFKAPSSGPASTDDSKSKGISVEWRR